MPPDERFVPRFAAEPPQDGLPYGRWAQRLAEELGAAWEALDSEGVELGDPGEIVWFPDRSWHGWTYVPGTALTSEGYELFGYVRFAAGRDGGEPSSFSAHADFTAETSAYNPEWKLDICEEVIGAWRGRGGSSAAMTLIWGRPLLAGGVVVSAELGGVTVDLCEPMEGRFTLIAPDDYQHDLLEVVLWGAKGQELARESLYEEGNEDGAGRGGGEDEEAGREGNTARGWEAGAERKASSDPN